MEDQFNLPREDFDGGIDKSRGDEAGWNGILNEKLRFDVEVGHSSEKSALQRVRAANQVFEVFPILWRTEI